MNPIKLILKIKKILLLNYLFCFIFILASFFLSLYTQSEFLQKLLLISAMPAAISSSYLSLAIKYKRANLDSLPVRVNSQYSSTGLLIAIASCVYFDLGLIVEVLNIGFDATGILIYYLLYELTIGFFLGGMLLPDLFYTIELEAPPETLDQI